MFKPLFARKTPQTAKKRERDKNHEQPGMFSKTNEKGSLK